MPCFDAICTKCQHPHEYIASMANCAKVPRCPKCRARSVKSYVNAPAMYGDMNDFSLENHGKGRLNPQLKEYVTSVADAKAKAAKRGWEVYGE